MSNDSQKQKSRSNQVHPQPHDNDAFEMDVVQKSQMDGQSTSSMASIAMVASAVKAGKQWTEYTSERRQLKGLLGFRKRPNEETKQTYTGLSDKDGKLKAYGKEDAIHLNRNLLNHFRDLAKSNCDDDRVGLHYLDRLMRKGANIHACDEYGQTVLHEVARAWHLDVMRFFLDWKADINQADSYGITPLHVAAALDYEEMVEFLIQNNASIEAKTTQSHQTPLHFAAKNDAVNAVKILCKHKANMHVRDYKQRTPLHLAADLDRSETAKYLMELGADAGVQDADGQLCLTAMVAKMTPVASQALDQLHEFDRVTRKQYFYLNLVEGEPRDCKQNAARTPLEMIILQGQLDLIMHPVILRLIKVKWNLFGRLGTWILLLLNIVFILSWTITAISVSLLRNEQSPYDFPRDWWRVFVMVIALLLTLLEIIQELQEVFRARKKLKAWKIWCKDKINADINKCHPMWPEEKYYLTEQLKVIERVKSNYFRDFWNIFDWLVYIILIAVFGVHVADIFIEDENLRLTSLRLFAVAVIFLWLRLMKHVRAFRIMGPFIVMLGEIVYDVLRFLFLYMEFYIPYACAFWIIFGGNPNIPSMETVDRLLYSLYRITLVDDYEFDEMFEEDGPMAYILCGTFLGLSAILCVNLLIALLSDTFQRVYDNATANAVMQKASMILLLEEAMPWLRRCYDTKYISNYCAPLVEFYDDDITPETEADYELKKATLQIKESLDEFFQNARMQRKDLRRETKDADGNTSGGEERHSISSMQHDCLESLKDVKKKQQQQDAALQKMQNEMQQIRELLHELVHAPARTPGDVGTAVRIPHDEEDGSLKDITVLVHGQPK